MIGAKISLKKAEKLKRFILKKNLLDFDYKPINNETHIIFPVKKKFEFEEVEFVKKNFIKKDKNSWIDLLKKSLTKNEFSKLITAHDVVGTIAILEIPEILEKKEELITKTLLKSNKNLKTILKKVGQHKGIFRTQKLKFLAGENTKETIHKENGVKIKVDVEKVYFSARLSSERKRIAKQVKEGEDILVMFSGCGPYTCVLSKNTLARNVFGIEINPLGHKYADENVKLNKLHNVINVNGDVKKVVPKIFHYLVGLKSADKDDEMQKRLVHHPVLMEFHLFDDDLFENKKREKLEKTIQKLQSKGIQVVLHMLFKHNGKNYSLGQKDIKTELQMFKTLGGLCKKYHLKAIIHPTQNIGVAEDEEMLVEHIKLLEPWFDYFYFENVTFGLFTKANNIIRIGKKAGIKNMCIDTCHLFITYQDNAKIENHIKKIRKHFNTYFHLNDHDYKTHSCEIGTGYIDFSKVLPYVNFGVTEVCSKNEKKPKEMVHSYLKIEHSHRKFDRILMPLPKSAEDFLPTALKVVKKGTIIHFYDFLHETEFDKCEEKVKTACDKNNVKYKVLNFVKCGQYSPGKYRVCLDFKITTQKNK